MAKHPTAKKGRRAHQPPPDPFIATVERWVAWGKENTRVITTAGVILLLVGAGFLYYRNYQSTIEAQAAARLGQLQQTVNSGNAQLAMNDLRSFVSRFGSTRAGEQARLVLADMQISRGNPDDAIQTLADMPGDLDGPYGIPAIRLLAAAYDAAGDADRAVQTYLRVADAARFPYQRQEALADAARVRLQNNQPGAAVELYDRLISNLEPADPAREFYEMWRSEAQAAASSAGS